MADEIHMNNIGTMFKLTILANSQAFSQISTATTKKIIFFKPDGTRLEKDASFFTDGSDGIITYTTVSGDLSLAGLWRIQAYVIIPSVGEFYSNIKTFTVYWNL